MQAAIRATGIILICLLVLAGCEAPGLAAPTATAVLIPAAPAPVSTEHAVATMRALPEPVETQEALATELALPTPTANLTPTVEPPTPRPTATEAPPELSGSGFKLKWQKLRAGIPAAASGSHVYLLTNSGLDALDAETGDKKWSFPFQPSLRTSGVALAGRLVVVNVWTTTAFYLYALDSQTGHEAWHFQGVGDLSSPLLAFNGIGYIVAQPFTQSNGEKNATQPGAIVYALDLAKGTPKWTATVPDGYTFGTADKTRGAFYFTQRTDATTHHLLRVDLNKDEQKEMTLPGEITRTLRLLGADNGMVYVADDANLYAVDGETERQRWHLPTSDSVIFGETGLYLMQATYRGAYSPSMHASGLDYTYYLQALDATTGNQKWKSEICGYYDKLFISDANVYVSGCHRGMLDERNWTALDAHTGATKWRLSGWGAASVSVVEPPAIGANGVVYLTGDIKDQSSGREFNYTYAIQPTSP
jgi:outer membrane protein assembly factor BamB